MTHEAKRLFDTKNESYELVFGEKFPNMMCGGGYKVWCQVIDECLATGKPYDPYDGGRIPRDAIF